MILKTTGTEVEVYGAETEEQVFQIQTSAAMFDTLSSKLYSDRVSAIIRELSCNAYDAHVAVGKKSKPFDINLPTAMVPEFVIRDYGPGLPDDQVLSLYCTYGASTKLNTNRQIGGFGIGSKSPFSYTDGFSVISYHGGLKRTYSAYVNEERIPAVVRVSTEASAEPTGLEIRFPVRDGDRYEFEMKAAKVFEFFDPMPNVNRADFKPVKHEYLLEGKNWKLRRADSDTDGLRIVQGMVVYKVNGFEGVELSEEELTVLGMNLDIFVPIGTLSPAATRESLTNDKKTVAKTRELIRGIDAEMKSLVEQKLSGLTTDWEKVVCLRELEKTPGLSKYVDSVRQEIMNDTNLFGEKYVSQSKFPEMFMHHFYYHWGVMKKQLLFNTGFKPDVSYHAGAAVSCWMLENNASKEGGITFVLADEGTSWEARLRRWMSELEQQTNVVVISPFTVPKKGDVFDAAKFCKRAEEMLAILGNPPYMKMSQMTFPEAPKKVVMKGQKVAVKSVTYRSYSTSSKMELWERTGDSLPTEGTHFYLRVLMGQPQEGFLKNCSSYNLKSSIDWMLKSPFIPAGSKLYAFTPSAKIPQSKTVKWVNLYDHLNEVAVAWLQEPHNHVKVVEDTYRLDIGSFSERDIKKLKRGLNPHSLFCQALYMMDETEKTLKPEHIWVRERLSNFTKEVQSAYNLAVTTDIHAVNRMNERLRKRYPALHRSSCGLEVGRAYIRQQDALHEKKLRVKNEQKFTEVEESEEVQRRIKDGNRKLEKQDHRRNQSEKHGVCDVWRWEDIQHGRIASRLQAVEVGAQAA